MEAEDVDRGEEVPDQRVTKDRVAEDVEHIMSVVGECERVD